jgi:Calcineurin-like phosphoesterase/Purple acid Phosphatase, N-terminal domain
MRLPSFLNLVPLPKRKMDHYYEPIPDHRNGDKGEPLVQNTSIRKHFRCWKILIALGVVGAIAISSSLAILSQRKQHCVSNDRIFGKDTATLSEAIITNTTKKNYHETIPTILSVLTATSASLEMDAYFLNSSAAQPHHDDQLQYMYAFDNPYYDLFLQNPQWILGTSHFQNYDGYQQQHQSKKSAFLPLTVPTIEFSVEENNSVSSIFTNAKDHELTMTLKWTSILSSNHSDNDHRDDTKDLFVLLCNPENDHDDPIVLEIASIEQIRLTHQKSIQMASTSDSSRRGTQSPHPPLRSTTKQDGDGRFIKVEYWYIPYVPSTLLRQSYCYWTYYYFDPPKIKNENSMFRQQQDNNNIISTDQYTPIAQSNPVDMTKYNVQPTGIHLSFTSQPDRILIQFTTGSTSMKGTPVVEFNEFIPPTTTTTHRRSSNKKVLGTTDTYTANEMCQEPANITGPGRFVSPGNLHTVVLDELLSNTAYEYRVGIETGQGIVWSSGTYHFTTAIPAGDDSSEFTFLVYGDQGCPSTGWEDGTLWMQGMASRELHLFNTSSSSYNNSNVVRMIHHVGDLSYAQGAAHIWDAWFDMIQPMSRYVPIMIAIGNHEYDHMAGGGTNKDPSHITTESGFMPVWGNFGNDSGGECGVPTSKRFTMPNGDSDSNPNNGVFWYWYDYGLLRTIVLSSEHDISIGSIQHIWFETVLRTTDRSTTPWIIAELHRPLYEGEELYTNYNIGVAMRYEIEDLLYDYRVDIVFAGHYHTYHRTYVCFIASSVIHFFLRCAI